MFELVLQFRGPVVEDVDEVQAIEDALHEMMADGEEVDGHSIGVAARNIYIATPDVEATFARVRQFLTRAHLLGDVIAAARSRGGDRYVVLWPQGHAGFSPT